MDPGRKSGSGQHHHAPAVMCQLILTRSGRAGTVQTLENEPARPEPATSRPTRHAVDAIPQSTFSDHRVGTLAPVTTTPEERLPPLDRLPCPTDSTLRIHHPTRHPPRLAGLHRTPPPLGTCSEPSTKPTCIGQPNPIKKTFLGGPASLLLRYARRLTTGAQHLRQAADYIGTALGTSPSITRNRMIRWLRRMRGERELRAPMKRRIRWRWWSLYACGHPTVDR